MYRTKQRQHNQQERRLKAQTPEQDLTALPYQWIPRNGGLGAHTMHMDSLALHTFSPAFLLDNIFLLTIRKAEQHK